MYNKYSVIADVKRYHNGHFFESSRVWNSRTGRSVYPDNHGGAYFTTSERMEIGDPRSYTVRYIDAEGDIRTVGEFMGYATSHRARVVAEGLSET